MLRRRIMPRAALLLTLALGGCLNQGAPLQLAQNVDLARMYGGWYIVATIPNWFEKGMVAPYDVYAPRQDGGLHEDFYFRRGGFNGKLHHLTTYDEIDPGSGNAAWHVQLVWPLQAPFLLLYVDPDYRIAAFGERGRNLGWIYARTPVISAQDYAVLQAKFAAEGYDPGKFKKFVQTEDQIGRNGFWSAGIRP